MVGRSGVGTLREKPLHAALKRWYAEEGDRIEEPVDGYVIDIVRGDVLVEIQTRGFSGLRRKLGALLDRYEVRIVHPIAVEKWIVKVGEAGEVISRRKSPKRGRVVDVFGELVSLAELADHRNLTIEVVCTNEEEIRRFEAGRAWRRKGWIVDERRLLDVTEVVVLESPVDLAALVPDVVPGEFTTADLAAAVNRPRRLAQQMTYCLRHVGVIEPVGKAGNAVIYARVMPE